MQQVDDAESRLSNAKERIGRWRAQYGGRGKAIPAELWAEAVAIADKHGVGRTARALKLNYRRLDERVAEVSRAPEPADRPTFIELPSLPPMAPPAERAVIRWYGCNGERLRIEVTGTSSAEVLRWAQAYCGGRP